MICVVGTGLAWVHSWEVLVLGEFVEWVLVEHYWVRFPVVVVAWEAAEVVVLGLEHPMVTALHPMQ